MGGTEHAGRETPSLVHEVTKRLRAVLALRVVGGFVDGAGWLRSTDSSDSL